MTGLRATPCSAWGSTPHPSTPRTRLRPTHCGRACPCCRCQALALRRASRRVPSPPPARRCFARTLSY
eukprot:scaffold22443_cov62-Phaeocystis_antarctica.AAC.9